MMEQDIAGNGNNGNNGHGRVTFVNVMTHEQIEMLRIQIAIYAAITEQLAEMHKNQTPQQNLAGVRMGNLYCNPQMTLSSQKICVRQRWTPTPAQLQILEELFAESTGTPSKQKINEITSELSQHGQINENNVYNWFQNRRARWKRKQQQDGTSNNAEPEVATAFAASCKDEGKGPLLDDQLTQSQQNSSAQRAEDLCIQNPEGSSDLRFLDPRAIKEGNLFASTIDLRAFQ